MIFNCHKQSSNTVKHFGCCNFRNSAVCYQHYRFPVATQLSWAELILLNWQHSLKKTPGILFHQAAVIKWLFPFSLTASNQVRASCQLSANNWSIVSQRHISLNIFVNQFPHFVLTAILAMFTMSGMFTELSTTVMQIIVLNHWNEYWLSTVLSHEVKTWYLNTDKWNTIKSYFKYRIIILCYIAVMP